MRPSLESLMADIPSIDAGLVEEHYIRLRDDYFSRFSIDEVKTHLQAISKLRPEYPIEILLNQNMDNSIECTMVAFDYPSEFALITGILAGHGLHILSGDVYTYEKTTQKTPKDDFQKGIIIRSDDRDIIQRRKIIDSFSGILHTSLTFKQWSLAVRNDLEITIKLLEENNEKSFEKARNHVYETVVKRLGRLSPDTEPILYPIEISVNNEAGPFTRLKVVSEDTPAFLYALSNALSLHQILIEHVRIRTIRGRIEDRIDLVDSKGRRIEDQEHLDRVKLSVLLTKQFTYFLPKAPDPYVALLRFEQMVKDIMEQPFREKWLSHLTDPHNLKDLARLLGTSDFLWEDFIRLQYESLLPMLNQNISSRMFSSRPETLSKKLAITLEGADSIQEKKIRLNRFKDQETFLIDLDHILDPKKDFQFLAERLTLLAELIINEASASIYGDLVERFGKPRTVAGLEARYSILGLGKLGGAALGYASDIELFFVYSDNGRTDGGAPIDNSEFFNRLVQGVYNFIEAKREGIFQIDLRLRPYGDSGPLACSLENFCRYYGQNGPAHSYERLSLVRLRAIGGDPILGKQLEHIRDELVYFSNQIDLHELQDLRIKQLKEKTIPAKINAKFSPGGLVDLEYSVQILQVIHGKSDQNIRTARVHHALQALNDAGILSLSDKSGLIGAYQFLRKLINGLRMLRGSAKDLFLPPVESIEFIHLARRMGYERGGPFDPAKQLHIDLETHMAVVRVFVEKYFGREALPSPETGTMVDVVLSNDMPPPLRNKILSDSGFRNSERAYVNLKGLSGEGSRRESFARLALLLMDLMKGLPNPDMALNNWERFIHVLASPEFHYHILLSQPRQLELLLRLFSTSQFLSDTLIRNPGFFEWLIAPDILHPIRKREDIEEELRKAEHVCTSAGEWRNVLRRFRRREMLRIGVRDMFLDIPIRTILQELSVLAEACTQVTLERCMREAQTKFIKKPNWDGLDQLFCIMAFGKLGGNELNYSSDIDLLGIYSEPVQQQKNGDVYPPFKEIFSHVMSSVRSDLSSHTEEGYVYRVDLRLRPFGSSGELVQSTSALVEYYRHSASLWEIQAALKLRPIAGNLSLGYECLKRIYPHIYKRRDRKLIIKNIEKMRRDAIKRDSHVLSSTVDVKSGMGGLRDVEFMIQGLQLIHASDNEMFIEGNTLVAIEALDEADIIPTQTASRLKDDYRFLRRTEHCLQILEDQQVHSLPRDEMELVALARKMLGPETSVEVFMTRLDECLTEIREIYMNYFLKREE
jgi:glutamate-ammonia-ligase adenylyltransferase